MGRYAQWKAWEESGFAIISKGNAHYYSKIFNRYLNGNISSRDVLEIGYGNGEFLGWCRQEGFRASGIEKDQVLIERANNNGFVVYPDLDSVPMDSFDLIFLFDVLEHIHEDEAVPFLIKLNRVLREKGRIVIRTPNGASPFGLRNQYGDPTHVNVVTATKLHFWAGLAGLNIIYSGPDVFPIYNGRIIKVPSRLLKIFLRKLIERMLGFIFSIHATEFLAPNLLTVINKNQS